MTKLLIKEYGLWAFITSHAKEQLTSLKSYFPGGWDWIITAAYCRLIHSSCINHIDFYYQRSFISEDIDLPALNAEMANLIKILGENKTAIANYCKPISGEPPLALLDATALLSKTEHLSKAATGLATANIFGPIVNLLYFYTTDSLLPVTYSLFDANKRDIDIISTTIQQTGYKSAIIMADKTLYNKQHLKQLEEQVLQFIIPLERESELINYGLVEKMSRSTKDYFFYENQLIHFSHYKTADGQNIHLFLDEYTMVKEKAHYFHMDKKSPQEITDIAYQQKILKLGTFALISNVDMTSEELFLRHKSRLVIEALFKGTAEALANDRAFIDSEAAVNGWLLINHIAVQIRHKIYTLLKEQNLLATYSIADTISLLSNIRKVKINGTWQLEPIIDSQKKLIKTLGLTIV